MTILAWAIIVISALITPISAISLLMILAKSHGTASTTLSGFLGIVVLPPASLVGGIGLLYRRVWALYFVMGLMALLIGLNVWELLTPRTNTTTHTSPSGVKTTVLASGPNYHSLPIILICGAALVRLLLPVVRAEFHVSRPVREDSSDGVEAGLVTMPVLPTARGTPPPLRPASVPSPAKQRATLVAVIIVLIGITAGMAWLVISGLNSGSTRFPSKKGAPQRAVLRQQEPVMFYVAIGIYAAIGLGCGGLAIWMVRAATRRDEGRDHH